jgi:hypothetical protein
MQVVTFVMLCVFVMLMLLITACKVGGLWCSDGQPASVTQPRSHRQPIPDLFGGKIKADTGGPQVGNCLNLIIKSFVCL